MHVKTISVTYGRKFNLGDYNSAEIAVTLWADTDNQDAPDPAKCIAILFDEAKTAVKEQALPLLKRDKQIAAEVTQLVAGKKVTNGDGHDNDFGHNPNE